MTKNKSIRIGEVENEHLKVLAAQLGYSWGDQPNVTELVEAIANKKVLLFGDSRLETMNGIIKQLKAEGKKIAALRLELLIGKGTKSIVCQIAQTIEQKTPFCFSYYDVSARHCVYNCSYGEIRLLENQEYLCVVCENDDFENGEELPQLRKNRCFRLDFIPENAKITPIPNYEWRTEGLYQTEVMFALIGNPSSGFKVSSSDEIVGHQGNQIVFKRQIVSDFWFIRQMVQYGETFEILAPDELRQKAIARLQEAVAVYEN